MQVMQTAKELGIHRATVYRWIKRAKAASHERFDYLSSRVKRKSTKPHRLHDALTSEQKHAIIKLRKQKKYTAEKLKKKLSLLVHVSTIHRILKANKVTNTYEIIEDPIIRKQSICTWKILQPLGNSRWM